MGFGFIIWLLNVVGDLRVYGFLAINKAAKFFRRKILHTGTHRSILIWGLFLRNRLGMDGEYSDECKKKKTISNAQFQL